MDDRRISPETKAAPSSRSEWFSPGAIVAEIIILSLLGLFAHGSWLVAAGVGAFVLVMVFLILLVTE